MGNKFICDKCGATFDIAPLKRQDGDLDIVYLRCPFCEEEYIVSVTDSVLRDAIESYRKTMESARTATDGETSSALARVAQQMKNENRKRCNELINSYRSGNNK